MSDQAEQQIRPEPVLTQFDVDAISTSVGNLVRLIIRTHSGQHVFFLVPEEAKALAGVIATTAVQASSGLILPNGVIPPPQDPKGN